MVGLQYLFLEPNADDPLNKGEQCRMCRRLPDAVTNFGLHAEAAEDLRKDRNQFASNVKRSLGGGAIKGTTYDRALK